MENNVLLHIKCEPPPVYEIKTKIKNKRKSDAAVKHINYIKVGMLRLWGIY